MYFISSSLSKLSQTTYLPKNGVILMESIRNNKEYQGNEITLLKIPWKLREFFSTNSNGNPELGFIFKRERKDVFTAKRKYYCERIN